MVNLRWGNGSFFYTHNVLYKWNIAFISHYMRGNRAFFVHTLIWFCVPNSYNV